MYRSSKTITAKVIAGDIKGDGGLRIFGPFKEVPGPVMGQLPSRIYALLPFTKLIESNVF